MLSRLIQYGLVGVFALAIANYGNTAFAQDEDPCNDDPCSDTGDDDDDGGGGAMDDDDDAGDDDDDDGGGGGGDMGGGGGDGGDMAAEGGHPAVTPKGKISVAVAVDVSLVESSIAKPLSIRPDVFYGVMPKLEAGVGHSAYALGGWWGGLGGGICVSGTDGGCAKAFNGPTGILANYAVQEQPAMNIVANGGIVFNSLDPMHLGIKLGATVNKMMGKIGISVAPNIYVGATKRDEGNKETLNVPVGVMYGVSPQIHAGLQTGITGPLDGFGDGYSIPVMIGGMYMLNANMMAGASFNLFRVAGFEGPGAADFRGLSIFFGWHN